MHEIGIVASDIGGLTALERVSPGFSVEGLRMARRRSWAAFADIVRELRPGMGEAEIVRKVGAILADHGSARSWHRPVVRIGSNTVLSFFEKSHPGVLLDENDVCFVDIGPNWVLPDFGGLEYEGDVGDTVVMGEVPEAVECVAYAKKLFAAAVEKWTRDRLPGPVLYGWMSDEAEKNGFRLVREDDGHRIGDFPHKAHFAKGFLDVPFIPSPNLWVLEVHVCSPCGKFGAFFEDILGEIGRE